MVIIIGDGFGRSQLIHGMRLGVGCRPTTPQYAAGRRVDPPPSVPTAIGTSPAATAAAPPELDHPGRTGRIPRVACLGVPVEPTEHAVVVGHLPEVESRTPSSSWSRRRSPPRRAGVRLRARRTRRSGCPDRELPASRNRGPGGVPSPRRERRATAPEHHPCAGPRRLPWLAPSAPCRSRLAKVCSVGWCSSARPRKCSVTSVADTSPSATRSRIAQADIHVIASLT